MTLTQESARTYEVRTYGCQMNVHDSERLSGLLEDAGYVPAADGARRRRGRVQHLRGPGERRQPALRQPRPPAARQEEQPRHADRRRRLPGPEGPRHDRPQGALGRRGLRHAQHRLAARAAGARPDRGRGAGRDRRVAGGLPLDAADPARVRLRGLGRDLRRLQQHLHLLHRAGAARQGEGPPSRRHPGRGRGAGRPRASSRSPCSARTSTPTASDFGDRQAFGKLLRACGDDRGPGAGPLHLPAPRATSPTT